MATLRDHSFEAKVLVVDDDPSSRATLRAAVSGWGYDVRVFGSGPEALETFDERTHAVAILEVTMPGMAGIELLRLLKEKSPAACVLMISTCGTIHDAVAAIRAGASDFLTKPVDYGRLRERTVRGIERWQNRMCHRRSEVHPPILTGSPSESGDRLPEFTRLTKNDQSAEKRLNAGILPSPGGRFRGPGSRLAEE